MSSWNRFQMKPWGENGELRIVVESPRGAGVKFKYDPYTEAFTVSRALYLGVTYPFDWGFVPGTENEDGDPVDALILHDASTYPGIVLPCRMLGMLAIDQKEGDNIGWRSNNRIIAIPTWHERFGELESADDLPTRVREEIEKFFQNTTFFTNKTLAIRGWEGPEAAGEFIKATKKNLDYLYDPSGTL